MKKKKNAIAAAQIIEIVRGTPAHNLPPGWWKWPAAIEAHQMLAREFLAQLPAYPAERFSGRGIVVCAGGHCHFTNAWVCLRMLRHLGCALPVQLWHFEGEVDRHMARLVERFGAECIDASRVARTLARPPRILNGWELKPFAILHSSFREVLLLDADNVPVIDPEFLFSTPEYGEYGTIFWPDFHRMERERPMWRAAEVPYRDEPEVESGQIVLDKSRCWRALNLAMHYNEYSDFYFKYIHGDKCTFQFAWPRADTRYAMPSRGIHALDGTMCQHDFDGRRVFQHRNMDKWMFDGSNRKIQDFQHEEQCRLFLRELRKAWSGHPFIGTDEPPEARALFRRLANKPYLYRRVGADARKMVLLGDSRIGEGAGGCERFWSVNALPDGLRLIISGDDSVTCQLCAGSDGVFRGRWLRHERPLIELVPLGKAAARPPPIDAHTRTPASPRAAATDDLWKQVAGGYMCHGLGQTPEKLFLSGNGRVERDGRTSFLWWLDLSESTPRITLTDFSKNAYTLAWGADGVFRALEAAAGAPVELAPVHPLGAPPGVRRDNHRGERFYIGIPTVSRYDLLNRCLDAILDGDLLPEQIFVMDNGGGYYCHHPLVTVIQPGANVGVAGAWNRLHQRASANPIVLMNDDVLPSRGTLAALISSPGDFVTALPGENAWSCFLQRESVWREVGDYDERFWPAYYEDNDYRCRMENAGLGFFCVETGAAHQSDSTRRRLSAADAAELE
ncbi:MAG TPA: glycosyltransferase, partial [Pirellulales bacterium]